MTHFLSQITEQDFQDISFIPILPPLTPFDSIGKHIIMRNEEGVKEKGRADGGTRVHVPIY